MLHATYLPDGNHHLFHPIHLQDGALHLTQFDAQTTQLDLVVGTAEDDDITVGQPLGIVTRLINTLAMIVHEALAGHLIEVVVASGHTLTTDVQFAHHAHRKFVAIAVDDVLLDVQLRLADRNEGGMRQFGVV